MITYKNLGSNGRLGNQIFQYAVLFAIGFLRGFEIGIPKGQQISNVFSLGSANYIDENHVSKFSYNEPDFSLNQSVFLVPDETDIVGYFQSGSYFRHCAEQLRKELVFSDETNTKASEFISQFKESIICSLHIRRGDYLNLSHYHKNLDQNYYQNAFNVVISNFPNAKFLVFSDDIDWCKNLFKTSNFSFVDLKNDELELCIMSKCNVHIIANSSFSWWGAWLSRSNAVIAPKEWFAEQGPKNWESVYEPGWITV